MHLRSLSRPSLVVLAALVVAASGGCDDDDDGAAVDATGADGGAATGDGGAPGPGPGAPGADGGAPVPDAGVQPTPGTALVLPMDTMLLTFGRPRNIDTPTDIALITSLHYATAYLDGQLITKDRTFRFIARTWDAQYELPAGGVRVWWMRLADNGNPTTWVCRETDSLAGITTLEGHGDPETTSPPENLYRQQCSWTLWKDPTSDKWAIRAPAVDSDAEGGLFVTLRHSTANQAYHVQVAPSAMDEGPFFTLKSTTPGAGGM